MSNSVPSTVIWKKNVKARVHQILWWMVDAGVPGHILQHGWQAQAAEQLGLHRLTIHRQVEIMIKSGILLEGPKKGEVMMNLKIFDKQADRELIRMRKIGRGDK